MLQSRETVLPGRPAGGSGEEANPESILHVLHKAGNPLYGGGHIGDIATPPSLVWLIFSVSQYVVGMSLLAGYGRRWTAVGSWQKCRAITLAIDAKAAVGRGTVGETPIGHDAEELPSGRWPLEKMPACK